MKVAYAVLLSRDRHVPHEPISVYRARSESRWMTRAIVRVLHASEQKVVLNSAARPARWPVTEKGR